MSQNVKVVQKEDEPRLQYLVRVLRAFMEQTPAGENTIIYDEARCDGVCLADDFQAAVDCYLYDDEV